MIFQQILNEEAGCLSYLIGCGQVGQAAVVDPARDRVDEYVALARRKGLAITEIVDTHVHADHVSGNQALAEKTGARILLHPAAEAAFRTTPIEDAQEIVVGNIGLRVLHTPGHTPDSVCLVVTDRSRGDEPWFVLTGDTLFIGDVGRPDFGGERAAATLYRSLTSRLLALPDSVEVYPAHGAGSSCGRAMSSKTASTIGFERRFNLALRAATEDEFVRALMTGLPPKPPNFDRIIARNRARALPLTGEPRALSANQAREAIDKGAVVVDVRTAEEFGAGHIPGAINVWVDGPQFANRVGMFVAGDRPLVLVAAGPTDLAHAVQALGRVGLDDVTGHLQWGMGDWKNQGLPVAEVPQISVHDLATMKEERPELVVVDVREPFEWDEGHIDGAQHVPLGEIVRRRAELPPGRPIAVVCAGGLRSSLAISALAREGVPATWFNVAGGMGGWTRAGYPSTKRRGAASPA
ncbi:MAG TPA: rhodanese-like domain-containing protein [Verrucomicrobiae bacterium]|jgi:hydroxyacylglutathione hydrolase|nr:rhodanese-like domain-containing protein [Verrucomicrobiae bacterium]